MRRTVATAVLVVGVGLVLAAPEVRRSIGSRAAAAVETVRDRMRAGAGLDHRRSPAAGTG